MIPVKSCNCVSECNQALKNHQIFLRARTEVTRKHNKVNEKLGEKRRSLSSQECRKWKKIVLLYKGREVILEEDKVCSAAAVWSLVERRKTKERSEIPSCKTNGVNQRKVPKTVVIDGAFCYFLCSAKQNVRVGTKRQK